MAMLDAKMTALAQQFLRNEALVDQVAVEAISSPAAAVELCAITKLFAALAIDLETELAVSRHHAAQGEEQPPADEEARWTLPELSGNGAR